MSEQATDNAVIIPCAGCGQKLRVPAERTADPGKCPRCGTGFGPVAKPSKGRWRRRVRWLCIGYLVVVLAAAIVVQLLDESWWGNTLLLFGPRWVLAMPLVGLVPVAGLLNRRGLLALLIAAGVYFFLISGLRLNWPPDSQTDRAVTLRVITCNTGGAALDTQRFHDYLIESGPDVVLLQEWSAQKEEAVFGQGKWNVVTSGGLTMASRLQVEALEGHTDWRVELPWQVGAFRLTVGTAPIRIVNVHLPTVRAALEAAMRRQANAPSELEANARGRDYASAAARVFAREGNEPLVVGGDFNLPPESSAFRQHWGDLGGAFDAAGIGFGRTKFTQWHGVRIDHILFDQRWSCQRCTVGPPVGSDHRPVLADLRLVGTK